MPSDQNKREIVFLVGPPWAGKSTVAEFFKKNHFGYFSTRKMVEKYLTTEEKAVMAAGGVISDVMIIDLLSKHFPTTGNLVVDTPRSADQVYWFRREYPESWISTCYLTIDEEQIWNRFRNGNRENREDDDEEILAKRLKLYREYSEEMLPSLHQVSNLFIKIDANQPLQQVGRETERSFALFTPIGTYSLEEVCMG